MNLERIIKRGKNFLKNSIIYPLALSALISGCKKEKLDTDQIPANEKVVVLDEDSELNNIQSYSYFTGTIKFYNAVNDLEKGNIIVSIPCDPASDGFLRRVTQINSDGKTVNTAKTNLEEAVKSDKINSGIINLSQNMRATQDSSKKDLSERAFTFEYYFNDEVIYDKITATGYCKFNYSIDLGLTITDHKIEYLNFKNIISEQGKIQLNSEIYANTSKETQIINKRLGAFVIGSIGVIPVVVTPILKVNLGFEGEISANSSVEITQDASIEGGVYYYPGYNSSQPWGVYNKLTKNFSCTTPTLSASTHVKGYIEPELDVYLYGVAGPYASAQAYLRLNTSLVNQNTLSWSLMGGVDVYAGIKMEILGNSLANYEKKVIEWNSNLKGGQININPPSETGKIAFTSDRNGYNNIYIMVSDGSNQTNIASNSFSDLQPNWSPDGTKIAFTSKRDNSEEVYIMNANGSGQTRLTNSAGIDYGPSWSSDGSKIAFTSTRDANSEIYVMNSNGSSQTRLTNNSSDDFTPSCSSDGTKIVYSSRRDGNPEIYIMNSNGSSQTRLTNNSSDDFKPSCSPVGNKIAFYSKRDGNYEIYAMNSDGSSQTRLTNNSSNEYDPEWSLDGNKIAFVSDRTGNLEIYVMNSDGSNQINITNNSSKEYDPAWCPVKK